MRSLLAFFVLLFWLGLFSGCGAKYDVVPVSGTITLNGEPLAGATILTQPVSAKAENDRTGPGSFGKTDDQGHFSLELQTDDATPGAIPGQCVVMITEKGHSEDATSDVITREDLRSRVPREYRDGGYTYTIPDGGTDAMDIEIETKKRR